MLTWSEVVAPSLSSTVNWNVNWSKCGLGSVGASQRYSVCPAGLNPGVVGDTAIAVAAGGTIQGDERIAIADNRLIRACSGCGRRIDRIDGNLDLIVG